MSASSSVIDLTGDSPPLRPQPEPPRTRSSPFSSDWEEVRHVRPTHLDEIALSDDGDDDVSIVSVTFGSPRGRRAHRRRLRPRVSSSVDWGMATEAPPGQVIHEGIPPGPYTRHTSIPSAVQRMELMERLEMLASRYVARTHAAHGATPQTLLRPYGQTTHFPTGISTFPKRFDPTWTHPLAPPTGFSHSIVEPAVDVEGVSAGDHEAVSPLPNTTPICALCHSALVLHGVDDQRVWALPCGHVIDGRCVADLSDRASGHPHVFTCPVAHCKQRCHPEPGHAHSCIEVYS
ncbi:hypothetical protein ACI68E_003991 [Malassezia pachydermatis]